MSKRIHLLFVEDDEDDRFLLRRVFKDVKNVAVEFAIDGVEAQRLLREEEKKFVDVIITDLKMPRCDGFELLEWVRSQKRSEAIPVVILSSSALEQDVERAYRMGANTYFKKPAAHSALREWSRTFVDYWCDQAEIPG